MRGSAMPNRCHRHRTRGVSRRWRYGRRDLIAWRRKRSKGKTVRAGKRAFATLTRAEAADDRFAVDSSRRQFTPNVDGGTAGIARTARAGKCSAMPTSEETHRRRAPLQHYESVRELEAVVVERRACERLHVKVPAASTASSSSENAAWCSTNRRRTTFRCIRSWCS